MTGDALCPCALLRPKRLKTLDCCAAECDSSALKCHVRGCQKQEVADNRVMFGTQILEGFTFIIIDLYTLCLKLLWGDSQDPDNFNSFVVDVSEILCCLAQLLRLNSLLSRTSLDSCQNLSEPNRYRPPGLFVLAVLERLNNVRQLQARSLQRKLCLSRKVDIVLD
jgi:hypothetical protein